MNNENFLYEHYIKGQKEDNIVNIQQKSLMNNGFIENNTQPNTNETSHGKLKEFQEFKRNEKIIELHKKVERIKTQNDKVIYEVVMSNTTKQKESESCFLCAK